MNKWLRRCLWVGGALGLATVALLTLGPKIYAYIISPDHSFGDKPLPPAPDYNLREHWSAWPDQASPAERRPEGVPLIPQEDRLADAFFLHPTTYGGTDHWLQPMADEDARRATDLGTISRQASAFNGCCRVYAPRYRQANIMGYAQAEVGRIMDVGYQDVRAAFHHFITSIDPDGPIVLGSHSQGTFQMIRLLMEEIDGTPLMDRLVAVYAIGHSLPSALVEQGYQDIELCRSPEQTGCFISWDAHEGDKTPSRWSEEDEEVLWNGRDYSGFPPSQRICVNPISWTTGKQPSVKRDHLGALPTWTGYTEVNTPLPALIAGTVSAYCEQGQFTNWLFVNGDRDVELKDKGIWSLFSRNLHGADYSMFWANIRQNAAYRTQVFLAARKPLKERMPSSENQ